jgi:uncharacterized Zn ribbon protein
MKPCSKCNSQFKPKVSYQIYCSAECREEATREKIADRYQITKRSKRSAKGRTCKSCKSRLSIYNDTIFCDNCTVDATDVNRALREIRGIANGRPFEDDE